MDFPLSNYQTAIVDFFESTDKNIAVVAVAGAGKSFTLKLLASRVKAKSAVALAFNKHIAEPLDKYFKSVGSTVQGKTIHSLGYAACLRNLPKGWKTNQKKYLNLAQDVIMRKAGYYPEDERYNVASSLADLVEMARLNNLKDFSPAEVWKIADAYDIAHMDEYLVGSVAEIISRGSNASAIKQIGIDFADMIFLPNYLNWKVNQYELIFGDECQDWNNAMIELIKRSMTPNGRLVAVGDPDQAIMGFAGANTDSFNIVRDAFNCQEMPLYYCYRCGKNIVKQAQATVPHIESPEFAKDGIVDELPEMRLTSTAIDGDAILCRKTAPLVSLCLKFIAEGKTARVKGRKIGEAIVTHLKKAAKLGDWEEFPLNVDLYRQREMKKLIDLKRGQTAKDALNDTCDCLEIIYQPTFANVHEMEAAVLALFADDIVGVTLSTVHRAKGLEWSRVFIYKPEFLPLYWKGQTKEEARQERNLKYVAETRAKDWLTFVLP